MLPRLTTQMPRKYIAGRNSLLPAAVMYVYTRHINKVGGTIKYSYSISFPESSTKPENFK